MKELENELLNLLTTDDGYWYGWDDLCIRLGVDEARARKIMYSLKAQGLVEAQPIFDDCLRLNGKGWFKIHQPNL